MQQAVRPDRTPIAEPDRIEMTLEQYRDWQTGERNRGEWVDGEVIVFVAPKTIHQRISMFLASLLAMYTRDHDLGEVLQGPEMRLRDGGSYREPDIAFVATVNTGRISADGIGGPADLVVELVSDDSVRRDRKQKYDEYAAAGVNEYWVIDPRPLRRTFVAYALSDEGYYDPIAPDGTGRIISIALPGLTIDPTWLWEEPLPDPRDKLAELGQSRQLPDFP